MRCLANRKIVASSCLALLTTASLLIANPPVVPVAAGTKTFHDVLKERIAFEVAYTLAAYDKHGRHDPAWDDAAREFLKVQIPGGLSDRATIFYSIPDVVPIKKRREMAEALLEKKCNDAFVLHHIGRVLAQFDDEQAITQSYRALDQADHIAELADYPAFLRLRILVEWVVADRPKNVRMSHSPNLDNRLRDLIPTILTDREILPAQRRLVFDLLHVLLTSGPQFPVDVAGMIESTEQADKWVFHSLMGRVEITRAWAARSGRLAGEVKPEQWEGFRKHLKLARDHLEKAIATDDSLPHPFELLIGVTMGEGGDTQLPFEQAIARQVDYLPAYSAHTLALMPKWGGELNAAYGVALAAMATERYDTAMPALLMSAIHTLEKEDLNPNVPQIRKVAYPDVLRMTEGYATKGPSPTLRRWGVDTALFWAYRQNDWKRAGELLDRLAKLDDGLGPKPNDVIFSNDDIEPVNAFARIRAMSGPAGEAVQRATELQALDERATKYTEIASTLDSSDPGRAWLERRAYALAVRSKLSTGEWTPIDFAESLPHARIRSGTWTRDADGSLLVERDTHGPSMMAAFEMPSRFEMRFTVELVDAKAGPAKLIFSPIRSVSKPMGIELDFKSNEGRVFIASPSFGEDFPLNVENNSAKVHVRYDGREMSILDSAGKVVAKSSTYRLTSGGWPVIECWDGAPGAKWKIRDVSMRIPVAAK